jgi:transposase
MPKATDEERALIGRLYVQGRTQQQIANELGWTNATAVRSVARLIKQMRDNGELDVELPGADDDSEYRTLDELTREQRVECLRNRVNSTPRFKLAFKAFSAEEQAVFIDEYMSIVASIDSLTEAEEQALFAAIGEYILAYRALNFKSQEERWYQDSMERRISPEDNEGNPNPQYRRVNDSEKYQKQYDSHMKLYQKGISELKMSRVQRMKEVRSDRKSLVDVIEQYSHKAAQADASERITELSKLRDEELQKMLDEGSLYGVFED